MQPHDIYKSMCLHKLELPKMKGMEHDMDECLNPPTIHMNQCDFTTRTFHEWTEQIMWMNIQPYHPFASIWLHNLNFHEWMEHKSCGWIWNPSIHFESMWLHNLNLHKWTEWTIWMNVTPPYIYELKATGWIEFECIRTMIKNGEDLLTKSFPTTKAPNWVLPDMFKTNWQRQDPKNRRYYTWN